MSQQCVISDPQVDLLQQLQQENSDLKKRLTAQQKILASLENRVARSLDVLQANLSEIESVHAGSNWHRSLNYLESEVQRLSDLLSDALLLQKLEARKVELNLESLDLKPILNALTRHLLEPKDGSVARLLYKTDPSLPPVLADQELTEAVLTELLARGLKYSDVTSPVVFEVEPVGDFIHLCISAQRFAPIGDRDSAPEIALCCKRIEVQNGEVTCKPRPDGLNTVTVALPIAQ